MLARSRPTAIRGVLRCLVVVSLIVSLDTVCAADLSVTVAVASGALDHVRVEWADGTPLADTVLTLDTDHHDFYCRGYDSDSLLIGDLPVEWSFIGDDSVGALIPGPDSVSTLTLYGPGSCRIAVLYGSDMTDTSGTIIVVPGRLHHLVISPDSASLKVGDQLQFTVQGYDSLLNLTDVGLLTWGVIGEIGDIDDDGYFTSLNKGMGRIIASSSLNGVSDTTNPIIVDVPVVRELAIGNVTLNPGTSLSPVIGFKLHYPFDDPKHVVGVTLRNASRGQGSSSEVLGNVEEVSLYLDANLNQTMDAPDELLASTTTISEVMSMSFSPILIGPGLDRTFFVTVSTSIQARDSDSLDFYLMPAIDISTEDGALVAGPDTVNSLGFGIIDGFVSDQLALVSNGNSTISPTSDPVHALTVRIPRNGYQDDTLAILSLENSGTASAHDIESLILYKDNGDGLWGGGFAEDFVGVLAYTGGLWSVSGIAVPLSEQMNTFHVGLILSDHPVDDATIVLGIPEKGIEVASYNDGPIDEAAKSADTLTISSPVRLFIDPLTIAGLKLIPGTNSGPMTGLAFTNTHPVAITIDSIGFRLFASDPLGATQAQLDSQVDSVQLWLNRDGNISLVGLGDSLLATARIEYGYAVFPLNSLTIPENGGSLELAVNCLLSSRNSKNGNILNIGIELEDDIWLQEQHVIAAEFPLRNVEDFTIDAFPSASIHVNAVPGATLSGGESDVLAFDFELPSDGYSSAVLHSLRCENLGSMQDQGNYLTVKLWQELEGSGFSASDLWLGNLDFLYGSWVISDLNVTLTDESNRLYLTVDVMDHPYSGGGTIRFGIPVQGIRYSSNTNGPDDMPVSNPEAFTFYPSDEITVISNPSDPELVYPGSFDNSIMTFALYNGYKDIPYHLTSIRLSNRTVSNSSFQFADEELGQVSIYRYTDDGGLSGETDLLATGHFVNGNLTFAGLSVLLPAESIEHFVVNVDVPINAIDSDTLRAAIQDHSDFGFDQLADVNGDVPLLSGGYLLVDGSVREQYELVSIPIRTLSPGDLSVWLMGIVPAPNGDLVDTLESIALVNLGNADSADIVSLELWLDTSGDGIWQSTDSVLGSFSYVDGTWLVNNLSIDTYSGMPPLFVLGDVSAAARSGNTVRLAVPLYGFIYASENDGPIDGIVAANETFTISDGGLHLAYDPLEKTRTVGQVIGIDSRVTNLTDFDLDSIVCSVVPVENPELVELTGESPGPVVLRSGDVASFEHLYTSLEPGLVRWRMKALSLASQDSTASIITETVTIQMPPSPVTVQMASSTPSSVTRGQSHVFPFSLSYQHPDVSPLTASLRLESLRIRVLDDDGVPQSPSDAFSRMVLSTSLTTLAAVDIVSSNPEIELEFYQPAVTLPGQTQTFSLRVDIDSLASAKGFSLAIESASYVSIRDHNTGTPVTVTAEPGFPLVTASCAIEDPSQHLAVSSEPVLPRYVNYGQENVDAVNLIVRHPGDPGSSQIQMTRLAVEFIDGRENAIEAEDLISEIRVLQHGREVGRLADFSSGSNKHWIQLTAPPVIGPGSVDSVVVQLTLNPASPVTEFQLSISDTSYFVLRDISSGAVVPAISDTSFAVNTFFPILSGLAEMRYPASTSEFCLNSLLPVAATSGTDSLDLIELELSYPELEGFSPISLVGVELSFYDSIGNAIDPDRLFDRIGYRSDDSPIVYQQVAVTTPGSCFFGFQDDGILIEPDGSVSVRLLGDIEADVPYSNFVATVNSLDALFVDDATDSTHSPWLVSTHECPVNFPFVAGPTEIFIPAGRPEFSLVSRTARIAHVGQDDLVALEADIGYPGSSSEGDLAIRGLRAFAFRRTAGGLESVPTARVFRSISMLLDNNVVAVDTVMLENLITFIQDEEYIISAGSDTRLSITCDLSDDIASGNYLISIADSSAFSMYDKNLETRVDPVLLESQYPLYSADIAVAEPSLEKSFSNYPNPFIPSRDGSTRFAYVLPEAASVDIEIFTTTGDLVKVVLNGASRSEGSHQSEVWFGVNDAGHGVAPGAYICRITARYLSGRSESFTRKVGVVR